MYLSSQYIYSISISRTSVASVEAEPLKMPATDAGETLGICSLRPWPTRYEDTIYIDSGHESLNQYINLFCLTMDMVYAKKKGDLRDHDR